ncbi:MAG: HmuY family protein [Bacteroidales bacterium]|nr:HmuY family protein [Bacteroidales bacterium]
MKKPSNLFLPIFALMALAVVACKKDDASPEKHKTIMINASSYSDWVYFSFEKDKIVQIDNFSTSLDWDLGFHRYDLRVNCGKSGKGKGGSLVSEKTDFDSILEAPTTGYSLNDSIEIYTDLSVMPPVEVKVPGDTVLAKWITKSFGAQGPQYKINNKMFVIKTASGKYAKIWLRDFFNNQAKAGHITMQYIYQPDGSRNLDL